MDSHLQYAAWRFEMWAAGYGSYLQIEADIQSGVIEPGWEPERAIAARDTYRASLKDEATEMKVRPTIVCLCGSTRFWREFQRTSLAETLAGHIVLSIGAASGTDDEHFGNLPREEYDRVKAMLDELHLRKIDLADEVLVLNVGGYIGDSTRREIAYATAIGRLVRYLEPLA